MCGRLKLRILRISFVSFYFISCILSLILLFVLSINMFNKNEEEKYRERLPPLSLLCPPRDFVPTAHEKMSYERVHIVLSLRDTVACKRAKHRSCSVFGCTKPRKSKLTNAISLCCCTVYGYLVSIIMLL